MLNIEKRLTKSSTKFTQRLMRKFFTINIYLFNSKWQKINIFCPHPIIVKLYLTENFYFNSITEDIRNDERR